jgi:hypothetical protein
MNPPLQDNLEVLRKRKTSLTRLPEIELWFVNHPVRTLYTDWATPPPLDSFNKVELILQRCFTYVCLVPRTKADFIHSEANFEFTYNTPTTKAVCKSCSLRYVSCSKWTVCASSRLTPVNNRRISCKLNTTIYVKLVWSAYVIKYGCPSFGRYVVTFVTDITEVCISLWLSD